MNTLKPYFFFLLSFGTLSSFADITVENLCGSSIRLSFHGDGCRLFDEDRYSYTPCEEKDIAFGESASFANLLREDSTTTNSQRTVIPRILFGSFGFSYTCRIMISPSEQCLWPDLFPNITGCNSTDPQQSDVLYPAKLTLLQLHGSSLTVEKSYTLKVKSGYGYFPQPYVDCDIKQTAS